MIFDLNDVKKMKDVKEQPSSNNVIRRVYHTRQEFNIYPNGQIYPGKIQGWFEDKLYPVKKKVKVKPIKAKKVEMKKEEVY